jgi:hypothetical protein
LQGRFMVVIFNYDTLYIFYQAILILASTAFMEMDTRKYGAALNIINILQIDVNISGIVINNPAQKN